MKLLIATANAHKVGEIAEILQGLPVELLDLTTFPAIEAPEESGDTFEANALLKARYYHELTGMPVVADDSGLEVDALDGRPGVLSSRYAGQDTPHSEKIRFLLGELAGTPEAARSARFRCVAVYIDSQDREHVSHGVCEGRIAHAPRGEGGFGYDPVFFVQECGCTMAELSAADKHARSHRGRAFRGLVDQLAGARKG